VAHFSVKFSSFKRHFLTGRRRHILRVCFICFGAAHGRTLDDVSFSRNSRQIQKKKETQEIN
jgi:hypothetical protein